MYIALYHLKQDYVASAKRKATIGRMVFEFLRNAGFRAVVFYRMGRWCRLHHMGFMAPIIERLMHHLSHCWISTLAEIGPGLKIAHVCGIVIPPGVQIGRFCELRQNVTLGGNYGKTNAQGRTNPKLGDHVSLGPGAVLLGPIEVGDHAIIGANAVVTTDIPARSVAGAFRAEVLATVKDDDSFERLQPSIALSRRELAERLRAIEDELRGLRDLQR